MLAIKEKRVLVKKVLPKGNFILVADIGGTKTDFAVVQIQKNRPKIILTIKIDSKKIDSFESVIEQIIGYIKSKHKIVITKASIAAAGPLSVDKNCIKLTNLKPYLDAKRIKQKTSLKSIVLLNDMQAAGYGLHVVDKKFFIQISKVKIPEAKLNKVVLAAGTGLGQCFVTWNSQLKRYLVFPSEGGQCSFSAQNKEELDLLNFAKRNRREDFVSGTGITTIYKFLQKTKKFKKTKYSKEIEKSRYCPKIISKYRTKDLICKKSFELFAKFYARSAKDFTLDILAEGGVYIAGKIAKENIEIFKSKTFLGEFVKHSKMKDYLSKIPIFVVTDLNINLYGAAVYASLHLF